MPLQSDELHRKNLGANVFPNRRVNGRLLLARLRNKRVFRGLPGPCPFPIIKLPAELIPKLI